MEEERIDYFPARAKWPAASQAFQLVHSNPLNTRIAAKEFSRDKKFAFPAECDQDFALGMSEFISVADVSSLPPGQGRTIHVRGHEYALWNLGGQFYCIDDRCPHRGGPLGAGNMEDTEVFCPLHGWGFDVRTGACSSRPDRPVKTYPTRIHEGQVQICI